MPPFLKYQQTDALTKLSKQDLDSPPLACKARNICPCLRLNQPEDQFSSFVIYPCHSLSLSSILFLDFKVLFSALPSNRLSESGLQGNHKITAVTHPFIKAIQSTLAFTTENYCARDI